MKLAKQCTVLFVWLSISLLLTGCWDRTEINDVAFVLASAIDLDKEGIRMTFYSSSWQYGRRLRWGRRN